MGIVSLRCLHTTGCTCTEQIIDAHRSATNLSSSALTQTHQFEVFGATAECILVMCVLGRTSSGGYAFKVRQLTLTDEVVSASRVAAQSSGGASRGPRAVVHRVGSKLHEHLSRQQRAMIKDSY